MTTERAGRPRTAATPASGTEVHPDADRATTIPTGCEAAYREADAAVAWRLADESGRAHVDELASIVDNLHMLALSAAGPIVAPAIEILEGLGKGSGWEPLRDEPPGLWHDLRPSEALELRELVESAADDAQAECLAIIRAHLAAAAATFGERHPDLPVRTDWTGGQA